jgi:hypothetical protein
MLLTALLLLAQQPAVTPAPGAHVASGGPGASDAPRGDYVEARTASVFAGACHFGAEATTQGRAAVLGWHVRAGAHRGVDLSGVDAVAVVSAEANLADPAAARRAVLYLDAAATPAQREAVRAWLVAEHGASLGRVVRVKVTPVGVERDGDAFALSAGLDVELSGDALPDRACCRMPYDVWYEPLAPVAGRLVGRTQEFRVRERALDRAWSRPGENAAFFGRFGGAEDAAAVARR